MKNIWVDPPSGWLYGFPKLVPEDCNMREVMLSTRYPNEDIDFALEHMRVWPEREEYA